MYTTARRSFVNIFVFVLITVGQKKEYANPIADKILDKVRDTKSPLPVSPTQEKERETKQEISGSRSTKIRTHRRSVSASSLLGIPQNTSGEQTHTEKFTEKERKEVTEKLETSAVENSEISPEGSLSGTGSLDGSRDKLNGPGVFYSLNANQVYVMGIIDILIRYENKKRMENMLKSTIYDAEGISVIPPSR